MARSRRHARGALAVRLLLAGAGVVLLTGCAGKRRVEPSAPAFAMESRVAPAPAGDGTLEWVLPVSGSQIVALDPALAGAVRNGRIELADGSVVGVTAHVLTTSPSDLSNSADPTSVAARMGWWLGVSAGGRALEWRAEPLGRSGAGVSGGALVVSVDVERAGPRAMEGGASTGEFAGRALAVRWYARASEPGDATVLARPLGEEAMESAWIRASLAALESSPLTRWRARLARGELGAPQAQGAFDDPVVEALAAGIESQWHAALTGLGRENPELARSVVARLCCTLDFGGGIFVPGWESDDESLDGLLEGLLLARAGTRAVDAARAWLTGRPALLCWVVDDAGATHATSGNPEGTVGVANLSGVPTAAWARQDSPVPTPDGVGVEIVAVPPWSARRVLSGGPLEGAGASAAQVALDRALKGERVRVHAGETVRSPLMYTDRVPALAPGVRVGPFHLDWSLRAWRAASEGDTGGGPGPWSAGDGAWATTGLLYRGVDAPLQQDVSLPDRWMLYLEVGQGEGVPATPGDSVRIWLGPFGRSTAVLRVTRDGRVLDESPPGQSVPDMPRLARVAATRTGWACWVPIPVSAIETGGVLRLGVDRTDARGVRSSWPRASLPWQTEPSRIAVDTSTWAAGPGREAGRP